MVYRTRVRRVRIASDTAYITQGGRRALARARDRWQQVKPGCLGWGSGLAPGLCRCDARRAVQMLASSLQFYAAQRSGALPADNPVPWRGDSALGDRAPNGASLVGGYYDDGGARRLPVPGCRRAHHPAVHYAQCDAPAPMASHPCCCRKLSLCRPKQSAAGRSMTCVPRPHDAQPSLGPSMQNATYTLAPHACRHSCASTPARYFTVPAGARRHREVRLPAGRGDRAAGLGPGDVPERLHRRQPGDRAGRAALGDRLHARLPARRRERLLCRAGSRPASQGARPWGTRPQKARHAAPTHARLRRRPRQSFGCRPGMLRAGCQTASRECTAVAPGMRLDASDPASHRRASPLAAWTARLRCRRPGEGLP